MERRQSLRNTYTWFTVCLRTNNPAETTGNRYKIEILMGRTQKLKGLAAASLRLKTFNDNPYYKFSSAIIINSSVVCISPRQTARIYDCCTISKCIIDMTGGVLEEERRILSMADRGDLANEGSKV